MDNEKRPVAGYAFHFLQCFDTVGTVDRKASNSFKSAPFFFLVLCFLKFSYRFVSEKEKQEQ